MPGAECGCAAKALFVQDYLEINDLKALRDPGSAVGATTNKDVTVWGVGVIETSNGEGTLKPNSRIESRMR